MPALESAEVPREIHVSLVSPGLEPFVRTQAAHDALFRIDATSFVRSADRLGVLGYRILRRVLAVSVPRWTGDALEVSWLFVREALHLRDIESARLRTDFRYLLIFRQRLVLELAFRDGRHAMMVAPQRTLETFYSEIMAALTVKRSAPHSS
jgi:hypothetical protein